jgi:hypothetical protein
MPRLSDPNQKQEAMSERAAIVMALPYQGVAVWAHIWGPWAGPATSSDAGSLTGECHLPGPRRTRAAEAVAELSIF